MGRMRGIFERPIGLRYCPELLASLDEERLLATIRALDFAEVQMHGQVARRTVRHFGVTYDYDSAQVEPGDPIPQWLQGVQRRCAELMGTTPERLEEVLVTRYPPGATIGWHRDAPAFGEVVGVSLASPCLLRFQRGSGPQRHVFELAAEPRSAYVLAGPSRTAWQHSIPAVTSERFSITFRTLRRSFVLGG